MNDVELEAGLDMDALVAEKVMGCAPRRVSGDQLSCGCVNGQHNALRLSYLPHYSTDIASAWEVFEELWFHLGGEVKLKMFGEGRFMVWQESLEAIGRTAPEAICRAALKAVGK